MKNAKKQAIINFNKIIKNGDLSQYIEAITKTEKLGIKNENI
jgi:hypothetical protein